MNENDRDLILDLIEGRLPGPAAAAAQARIDASPALQAELATQAAVHDALGSAEPPQMTFDEQTALRAALMQQLHLSDAPAAAPVAAAPSRSRWWVPVFGLATAAAVVVGFVALGPFGDSNDSGPTDVAASFADTESSIAGEGSTMQREGDDGDAAVGGADAPAADVTTTMQAAAAEQSAEAAEEDLGEAEAEAGVTYAMDPGGNEAAVPEIAGDVPPAPELHADLRSANFSTRAVTEELEDDSTGDESIAVNDLVSCETALADLAPENLVRVEPIATGTDEGTPVVVLLLEFADGNHITATIDLADCVVVDFAPPSS